MNNLEPRPHLKLATRPPLQEQGVKARQKTLSTPYQRRTGYPAWGLLQDSKLVRFSIAAK